jgi:murein DD-endopeptidase MepM/ murein hydrolase activator NlpD
MLEFTIKKIYINFEKKIFLFLASAMMILCMILCIQYFALMTEIKKMILVKGQYYNYLEMVKKIIQEKNCDTVIDDSDVISDKENEDKDIDKNISQELLLDVLQVDRVALSLDEEDSIDERDEDVQKFQFISLEDEKQLKDLRKHTRQVVLARKKSKRKHTQMSLGVQQIAQLQKNSSRQISQDFTFHWPVDLHHFWLSSLFGARKKANGAPGFHYGIDLAAIKGTPVKAAAGGIVIQAQYVPGYGNNILIQHNIYYRTRYAHLNKMYVTVGQKIIQGQKIGAVGDSGSVRKSGRDASHLHFEIYHNGSHVNPLRYLFN